MKESNISCTLCIVGAGYAGISALHAAKSYLKPEDKVIIIDEKEGFGGQWLKQYGFVRLHQPYRHFTAGKQSWKLKKKRDYLASKDEVISHLNDIAEDCSKDLNINALWRHRFLSYSSDHSKVEILAESLEDPNKKVSIRAEKLIHSAGFDIKTLNPLKISSKRVNSISVTDKKIISGQLQKDDKPVYIIGGGKTAADCAHQIIKQNPGRSRKLVMVNGRGSWFVKRELIFPVGWRRYIFGSSKLFTDWFISTSTRFNGDNVDELHSYLIKKGFLHSFNPDPENFTFGILSEDELNEIKAGVFRFIKGHMEDIYEDDGKILLKLKKQKNIDELEIEEGSWIINCTGHLKDKSPRPILSDDGRVCYPQRSLIFTGPTNFLTTHLFFLGRLESCWRKLKYIPIEFEPRSELGMRMMTLYLYNFSQIAFKIPFIVLLTMKADFNHWFPWYRRVFALLRFVFYRKKIISQGEKLFDLDYDIKEDKE